MIDRKNFDLADAVILLEIYLNGKEQGKTLHEMAQQASDWMRASAITQGKDISASYRSVSGLTERLSCLRHIIEQDDKKAKPASRMFLEAIELYRSNSDRYNEIRDALLKQAKLGEESTCQSVRVPENPAGLPNGAVDCEEQSKNQITVDRKAFDLKDASILLDLYIKGQQRGATLREIAEEASQTYRSLALRQGIAVTSSYRSVDGLYGRLKSLQITYEGVEIKGKKPTKEFEEAVALYRTSPKEFEVIRNEALGLANESAAPMKSLRESDGSVNTQAEYREQFYTWLSGQVSRTMLSDIYACAAGLDAYCISKKLSRVSVFEISDSKEIRKIRTALESNKILRIMHRKQCKQMLMLLQQYEYFLQVELPKQATVKEEEKETAIDLTPVVAAPEIEPFSSVPQKNSTGSVTPTVFHNYLVSHGKNANEARHMISIVESLRGILQSNYHYDSLYAITDASEMTSIYLELLSDHRFVVLDKQQDKLCSEIILAYRSMLENGGSGAVQQTKPSNDQEDASQIGSTSKEISFQETEDIIRLMENNRLTYVDKRQQGGVLWLIGGMEHADFILQARNKGYTFKYCPGGGRSTGNKTAWYLVEDETESAARVKSDREISIPKSGDKITREISKVEIPAATEKTLTVDLQNRLAGVEYASLRSILLREGILTIDQFNALDLWDFMNRHNIYHKDLRARMYRRLSETGEPLDVPSEKKEHTITVAENSYTGATPAQAFSVFCNGLIVKYPAEMRQLVNTPYQGLRPIVLHQWDSSGKMLRLTGINAFIDPEMKAEDADKYAIWICSRCKELSSAANAVASAIVVVKSNRKDDEAAKGEKLNDTKEAAPSVVDSYSRMNNPDEENDHDNGGEAEPSVRFASALSEERLQDICLTDLSKSNDFSFCQFDFLEIEGVRYSAASSWRGAYIWTMNQLLRTHPEAFKIVLEKQRGLRDHTGATCVLENGSVICVQYSETELMRRLVGAIAICGISVRSVIVGYRPMKGRSTQAEEKDEQKSKVAKTDLSVKNNFAFCKPVYCTFDGETLNNAMFWQRVYLWLLNRLSENHQANFEATLRIAFKKQGRIRTAGYLDNGTAVEINLSATDLMRKATMIAQGCRVSPKDIIIGYVPRQEDIGENALPSSEPVSGRQLTIGDTPEILSTPLEKLQEGKGENTNVEKDDIPSLGDNIDQRQRTNTEPEINITKLSQRFRLTHCQPVYIEIEGIRYDNPKSWKDAFVWAMNWLLANRPENFDLALRRCNAGKTFFWNSAKLNNGAEVDVQSTATVLMQRLSIAVVACGVSEDRVVIGYYDNATTKSVKPVRSNDNEGGSVFSDEETRLREFKIWMLTERKIAIPTAHRVYGIIKASEEFIKEKGLDYPLIMADSEQAQRAATELLLRQDYPENRRWSEKYRNALKQYICFLRGDGSPVSSVDLPAQKTLEIPSSPLKNNHSSKRDQPSSTSRNNDENLIAPLETSASIDNRWQRVLKEGFPDGYIPGDFICQMQADAQWQEIYGSPCPLSDESIDAVSTAIGVRRDDRIYAKDEDTSALLDDICAEIDDVLATYTCVYPSRIYKKYEKVLSEQSIYSLDAMIEALAGHANKRFEQRHKLYVKPGRAARQSEDCRKVMRVRGGETTREELCETLWFISEDGVNAGINACPDIIRIGVGRWLLAEHFPIDAEDVQTIGDVIMRELEVKPIVRSNEIKGLLQRELPGMADDLAPYENVALINLLRYHLSDRFSFTATIITARGEKININDQFATFARERDRFTLGELEAVANENGTGIYWETVLQEAVRINQEELVNRNNIHFDVAAIDAVLDEFCPGKYEGLKQLPDALLFHLPGCGFPWNKYLLYSYLFAFSKRFMLCYRSLSKSGYFGAIVRRGCGIEEYKDLVEQILINSDGWTTSADALQLLVDGGYQEYYRYKRIDAIVARVKDRRA